MSPTYSRAAMSAYRSVGVESIAAEAAPHQLVVMLFNGARAAVAAAKSHLARQEIADKCEAISKAIAIIDGGLKASLDPNVGGELASNLSELYAYMTQRLLHANLKNDGGALDEVAQLLAQLGSAWEAIAAKPPTATTALAAPAAAPAASPSQAQPDRVAAAYGVR
jgi:flagellar protein FliS